MREKINREILKHKRKKTISEDDLNNVHGFKKVSSVEKNKRIKSIGRVYITDDKK